MKYQPPIGGAANDPYIDANELTGTEGSPVPAKAIEDPQREIHNFIVSMGLTPDENDPTQLTQAIAKAVQSGQSSVVVSGVTFAAGVVDMDAVRWDSATSKFIKAVADGTAGDRQLGFADVTNSKLYLFGQCTIFTGLTPGGRYYLDASTPGGITMTAPADAVYVGMAKTATILFIDVDREGSMTQAAADARYLQLANVAKVPVRQTVLSGPHNTDGTPNLGGSTGGSTLTTTNIGAGANTLVATAATGFSGNGQVDVIGATPSNVTWTGFSGTGTFYLGFNIAAGALTPVVSALAPIYGNSAPSTANGQFSYVISEAIGYVGNGSSAVQASRVYVGEVDVVGGLITAIRWYAYCGRVRKSGVAITATSVQTFAHNIGATPIVSVALRNVVADAGWGVGDELTRWIDGMTGVADSDLVIGCDGLAISFASGNGAGIAIINKSSGAIVSSLKANWLPVVRAERAW